MSTNGSINCQKVAVENKKKNHPFCTIISVLLLVVLECNHLCGAYSQQSPPNLIERINSIDHYANRTTHVTKDFIEIIDFAMGEVIKTIEWKQLFSSLPLPFVIPTCTNNNNSTFYHRGRQRSRHFVRRTFQGISSLKVCYEKPTEAWLEIYRTAGDLLTNYLNKRFALSLKAKHYFLNTTQIGYINTMKLAVDSGVCDIITSNIIYTTENAKKLHFHCPYGSSALAVLRSELDNSDGVSLYNTVSQLNDNRATIVINGGAFYNDEARKVFPNATFIIVNGGYENCFPYIANKKAHALVGDALDLSGMVSF